MENTEYFYFMIAYFVFLLQQISEGNVILSFKIPQKGQIAMMRLFLHHSVKQKSQIFTLKY